MFRVEGNRRLQQGILARTVQLWASGRQSLYAYRIPATLCQMSPDVLLGRRLVSYPFYPNSP